MPWRGGWDTVDYVTCINVLHNSLKKVLQFPGGETCQVTSTTGIVFCLRCAKAEGLDWLPSKAWTPALSPRLVLSLGTGPKQTAH